MARLVRHGVSDRRPCHPARDGAAVSPDTVSAWIAEANRIFRQVSVTFTLADVIPLTDHSDCFEIGNDGMFDQMCSYANNTGGLELNCVGKGRQ